MNDPGNQVLDGERPGQYGGVSNIGQSPTSQEPKLYLTPFVVYDNTYSMIGYKLLREDLTSASREYGFVQYGPEWVTIPGHGSYVAHTLEGLLCGVYASVLAEVEYEDPTGVASDAGVTTARRVRVLRHAVVDRWVWCRVAIRCARAVAHLSSDPWAMAAIEAAERCERERTPEAASSADRAWQEASAVAAMVSGKWPSRAARAAEGATAAAVWSAAGSAAGSAARAQRSAARAVEAAAGVKIDAMGWLVEEVFRPAEVAV